MKGGSGSIIPQKILKFQVPGNTISAISEAKSDCFNISFLKVKVPFFVHQNIINKSA